ncbi:hypothetical protein F4779DRAFT_633707 [Xylariaceae sp. FL0662B]|nr:hypothetical protein F4779DRAFT_633707 [Xylariaceae sp. FL0662B]
MAYGTCRLTPTFSDDNRNEMKMGDGDNSIYSPEVFTSSKLLKHETAKEQGTLRQRNCDKANCIVLSQHRTRALPSQFSGGNIDYNIIWDYAAVTSSEREFPPLEYHLSSFPPLELPTSRVANLSSTTSRVPPLNIGRAVTRKNETTRVHYTPTTVRTGKNPTCTPVEERSNKHSSWGKVRASRTEENQANDKNQTADEDNPVKRYGLVLFHGLVLVLGLVIPSMVLCIGLALFTGVVLFRSASAFPPLTALPLPVCVLRAQAQDAPAALRTSLWAKALLQYILPLFLSQRPTTTLKRRAPLR